nr:MAG TPA: hypothetical protein [Caudoviricetes sp.]
MRQLNKAIFANQKEYRRNLCLPNQQSKSLGGSIFHYQYQSTQTNVQHLRPCQV